MVNFKAWRWMAVLCVMALAELQPKMQYHQGEIYLTLPVTLGSNTQTFLSLTNRVLKSVQGHVANLSIRAYVSDRAQPSEVLQAQGLIQKMERYVRRKNPEIRSVHTEMIYVPNAQHLSAWKMSFSQTVPSVYIAIMVEPRF